MSLKSGFSFLFLFLIYACGSVSTQTRDDPVVQVRVVFAKLLHSSPRIHASDVILVIFDDSMYSSLQESCLNFIDYVHNQQFEKTVVITKSQIRCFQSVIPFIIAHQIAHIMFSDFGIRIDYESLELWSDRLGFQLLARIGENPEKTVKTVCDYFLKNNQENSNGKVRCKLLQQLLHLHLYDNPSPP